MKSVVYILIILTALYLTWGAFNTESFFCHFKKASEEFQVCYVLFIIYLSACGWGLSKL